MRNVSELHSQRYTNARRIAAASKIQKSKRMCNNSIYRILKTYKIYSMTGSTREVDLSKRTTGSVSLARG